MIHTFLVLKCKEYNVQYGRHVFEIPVQDDVLVLSSQLNLLSTNVLIRCKQACLYTLVCGRVHVVSIKALRYSLLACSISVTSDLAAGNSSYVTTDQPSNETLKHQFYGTMKQPLLIDWVESHGYRHRSNWNWFRKMSFVVEREAGEPAYMLAPYHQNSESVLIKYQEKVWLKHSGKTFHTSPNSWFDPKKINLPRTQAVSN